MDKSLFVPIIATSVSALLGLVAFFFKRLVSRNDKVLESLVYRNDKILEATGGNARELYLLSSKLGAIEDAAKDVIVIQGEIRELTESVTVLDRNLKTAFRKQDEIRDQVVSLTTDKEVLLRVVAAQKKRILFLAQNLTKMRSMLEKEGVISFGDDPWIMPDE